MLSARRIHPSFYSFDGHRAEYLIVTEFDDADLPFTEKSSVGESLRLKIITEQPLSLSVRVITDRGEASRQTISLPSYIMGDFGPIPTVIGVSERAHGWLQKQIVIKADEFSSPLALCSIAFKFQQREKLKKG